MTKTALITGASSGIGKAAAQLFAGKGWNVVATMRKPEAETELADGANMLVTRLDVQDKASIAAGIGAALDRFGAIDVLVNNAGFSLFGLFEATSAAKVEEQFAVNVFGVLDTIRAALPHIRKQCGAIVNVTSAGGIFTLPLMSLYHATKFSIEGFTESLAFELASQQVAMKLVEPGAVRTNFEHRMFAEFQQDSALDCYDDYVNGVVAIYQGMLAGEVSQADDVAKVIFDAANDRSERLRYIVGNDIAPLVEMRRTAGEDNYIHFMRSQFAPK